MSEARPLATRTSAHPQLLRRAFRSGLIVLPLVRIVYALALISGSQFEGLFSPTEAVEYALRPVWAAHVLFVVIAAVLVHIDRVRAHELLLQMNFGVSRRWFTMASLMGAAIADLTVQTLLLAL
jgi:hypothetical protein